MSHPIRLIVFLVVFTFLPCLHGFTQAPSTQKPPQKKEQEPQPVRVSASKTALDATGKSAIALTLHIEPGVAIYTNVPHEKKPKEDYLLIPTKIEFFDSNNKLVDTKFKFPRGTLVSGNLPDTYMYSGTIEIPASLPSNDVVEKLTVKYHGYRYSGDYLGSGYS